MNLSFYGHCFSVNIRENKEDKLDFYVKHWKYIGTQKGVSFHVIYQFE